MKEPAKDELEDEKGTVRFADEPIIEWETSGESYLTYTFRRGAKSVQFDESGYRFCRRLFAAGKDRTYLVAEESSANGMADEEFLYKIDWPNAKLSLIRKGVRSIGIDNNRDLMVCLQKDRNLSDLGDGRSVWTGDLYAMKLTENKLWPVVKGLVHVSSFSTRPSK